MKKGEKIIWIVLVIFFGVADLMALHNIYATDARLVTEYVVLGASFIVFLILALYFIRKRKL